MELVNVVWWPLLYGCRLTLCVLSVVCSVISKYGGMDDDPLGDADFEKMQREMLAKKRK